MARGINRKPRPALRATLLLLAVALFAACGSEGPADFRPGGAAPHSVDLSWTASASAAVTGYNVYRSSLPTGPFERLNSALVSGTTYTDAAVASGMTYYYVVTAVDSSGRESDASSPAEAMVP